jgi:hypothetical protein
VSMKEIFGVTTSSLKLSQESLSNGIRIGRRIGKWQFQTL